MADDQYHPSGRGPELIAVFALFMGLTTFVYAVRVYVRACIVKSFGPDDWIAGVGWLLFNFHGAFAIAGAYHGTGQHIDLIKPPTEVPIAMKWWWFCESMYVTSNMAVKLSISLMLLRFVVEKVHRRLIYIVTSMILVYSLAFLFLFIFQCVHPSFFWTRFEGATNGSCMDPSITIIAVYVYSGLAVVYDWTMAILPWFLVRKLQMNSRTKLMCAVILGLGSIASVATIVRIPYIDSLTNFHDFLYSTIDVAIWSCSETGISIIASCAATFRPLIRLLMAKVDTSKFHSKTQRSPLPVTADDYMKARPGKRHYRKTLDLDEATLRGGRDDFEWTEISKMPKENAQEVT